MASVKDDGGGLAGPGQQDNNHKYVWYHDLKWNISDSQSAIDQRAGQGREVALKLSDGKQVRLRIKSPDQLKRLIGSLERAI